MALLVRIRDASSGSDETRIFTSSPVRIGRNPLNDLTLDYGFVSQWHGVIKFDRSDINYVDLGSTNGTQVDGRRVPERTPVRISGPATKTSIGSLELTAQWTDETHDPAVGRPKIRTQFMTNLPDWAQGISAAPPGPIEPARPPAPAAGESAPFPLTPARMPDRTDATPGVQGPLMAVEELRTAYDGYRASWRSLLPQLRHKIESAPPAMREMTALFITSEFPQVTAEPEFAQMLTELNIDRLTAGCLDIEDWLQRITNDDSFSAQKHSPAIAMEHVGATLEVFADSFLELRRGYDQFGKEMGLGTGYDQSPLDRVSSVHEVIAWLMEPDAEQGERLNDLKRTFASFALHQVAMMGASVEGARDLLDSLSPGAISRSADGSEAMVSRTQAMLFRFLNVWPFTPMVSWSKYKRRFEATTEEDRFTRKLFGRKFLRAYLTLIGSQESR
jgi:predicted component of type VI protein secretion system